MRKPIDTILFDLDGTLVDSNELIIESFRQTFAKHFPDLTFSFTELVEMMGPPLSESFSRFASSNELVSTMIDTYRSIYQSLEFSYIKLYPNVIETLAYFKQINFNIGVVTTKFSRSAMPSIRHFGLDAYLDEIITLDDVTHHKPHPEPILKALENFNHQSVLMIGDSPSDLLAGINANTLTCGVAWSYKLNELIPLEPDFWIRDFEELIMIVNAYNHS
jgi:pyrophosphatase PpaX